MSHHLDSDSLLPRKAHSFSIVKAVWAHGPKCHSGPPGSFLHARCSVTLMHPNERGVPNLPILPGAAASPPRGSFFLSCQSRKPVQEVGWGLASCCRRTSLVTLLGKASEILDWPPTQALPWRATPWGLRAISTSTGDAFHSATWRNGCPYRVSRVRPGQDEAKPLAP